MSLPKVYITRPLPTKAVERLAGRCDVKMRAEDAPLDPAQLAESCREIEGLVATGVRVSEDVVAQAGALARRRQRWRRVQPHSESDPGVPAAPWFGSVLLLILKANWNKCQGKIEMSCSLAK